MRRVLAYAIRALAVVLALAMLAGAAAGQSTNGQITGRVTDVQGVPLAGITVAAAPVSSPDAATLTETGTDGRYVLDLPPGSYDVDFNTQEPVNDAYGAVTFGGPGPGPGAVCTVCGGGAVIVVAGVATPDVDAALRSSPVLQTGRIRPLSGTVIKVLGGRITFKIGCHIEPTGCLGTARLRLAPSGPTIATTRVSVPPGRIGQLVFKVPAAVRARLQRSRHHMLPALVEVTAAPGHTITHFSLV